jgi:hypothetical protein
MTSAEIFPKGIIRHCQWRIPVDPSTGLISFPASFCQFTTSKEELMSKVFLNIDENYKNQMCQ